MTTMTLAADPILRLDDLRDELLGGEWLVLDAELLHDLDAWTHGRLQWTPAKAARTVTRADSIDAILEGVRAGPSCPFIAGRLYAMGMISTRARPRCAIRASRVRRSPAPIR